MEVKISQKPRNKLFSIYLKNAKLKVRDVNRCSKSICQKKRNTLHRVTCIFALRHLNAWNLIFPITMYHIVILFALQKQRK